MTWPFDSEEQLDEWVEQFIEDHKDEPPDDPDERAVFFEARLQARAERYAKDNAGNIQALFSDPDIFAIHRGHEEAVWRFILKVIARRPPELVLGYLAAGLLEDLIAERGAAFIDRIEVEARRNPLFRETLLRVWQNSTPPDLWARVERARGTLPAPAP
jgi:hypothetical protein